MHFAHFSSHSSRPRFVVEVCLFIRRCTVSRPGNVLRGGGGVRGFDWIPKVRQSANLVDGKRDAIKQRLFSQQLFSILPALPEGILGPGGNGC